MKSDIICCPKCGKENPPGVNFCKFCGCKLQPADFTADGKIPKDTGRPAGGPVNSNANYKKWIIPGVIAAAAVAVIIVLVMIFNSPQARFNRAVEGGDFDTADMIYLEQFAFSELPDDCKQVLLDAVDSTMSSYENGTITYSDAYSALTRISFYDQDAGTKVNSRISYLNGRSEMESMEYEYAIRDFQESLDYDPEYEDAQEYLDDAKEAYEDQVISEAEEYVSINEYDSAIYELETALSTLGSSEAVQTKLDEINTAYTDYQDQLANEEMIADVDEVDALISSGEFEEAYYEIEDLRYYYSDDADAQSYIDGKEAALVAAIEEHANSLASGGAYEEALSVLDDAMESISDPSLQTTYDALYDKMPITLQNITVISSENVEVDDDVIRDRWDNVYDGAVIYDLDYPYEAYALYNLDKKYVSFTATMFIGEDSRNDRDVSVNIYLDEELVYTQDGITEESAPLNIELDVSGKTTMRIHVKDENSSSSSSACFGSSSFTKAAES